MKKSVDTQWIFDIYFFFFSSRRRHTRLQGDWSSDVCSSDLALRLVPAAPDLDGDGEMRCTSHRPDDARDQIEILQAARSAVVLDDLFDRAAEVDVDEVGPAGLGDHLGGTGHEIGRASCRERV